MMLTIESLGEKVVSQVVHVANGPALKPRAVTALTIVRVTAKRSRPEMEVPDMTRRWMSALITILMTATLATRAHSAVLCGRKDASGELADGATIKVRTACKSREIALDQGALSLQTPQGNPPGPPGRTATWKDANGAVVGALFSGVLVGQDRFDFSEVLVNDSQGRAVAVVTDGAGNLSINGFDLARLFYSTTDCTGTAFLTAQDDTGPTLIHTQPFVGYPRNGIAYYAPPSGDVPTLIHSTWMSGPTSQTDCSNLDPSFIFTPPSGCCSGDPVGGEQPVAPALTIDMSRFVQPFHIVVN
jgi:hypothetical protein